jgi:hypothetical protein
MIQKKRCVADNINKLILQSAADSCMKGLQLAIKLHEISQIKQSVYLLANIYNQLGDKKQRNWFALGNFFLA